MVFLRECDDEITSDPANGRASSSWSPYKREKSERYEAGTVRALRHELRSFPTAGLYRDCWKAIEPGARRAGAMPQLKIHNLVNRQQIQVPHWPLPCPCRGPAIRRRANYS